MTTDKINPEQQVGLDEKPTFPNPVGSTSEFLLDFLTNNHAEDYDLLTTPKSGPFAPDFSAESYSLRVTVLNRGVRVGIGPLPDIKILYDLGDAKREISLFVSHSDREITVGESP